MHVMSGGKESTRGIRFDPELLEKLQGLARAEDRSLNWLVQALVREALGRREGGRAEPYRAEPSADAPQDWHYTPIRAGHSSRLPPAPPARIPSGAASREGAGEVEKGADLNSVLNSPSKSVRPPFGGRWCFRVVRLAAFLAGVSTRATSPLGAPWGHTLGHRRAGEGGGVGAVHALTMGPIVATVKGDSEDSQR